jgi:hypothetical protein
MGARRTDEEIILHEELVRLYIRSEDWPTAAAHIYRYMQLEEGREDSSVTSRIEWLRFGTVFSNPMFQERPRN